MKLTNKDLLKLLSLQIGDKIKTDISILEVKKSTSGIIYLEDTEDNEEYNLSELVDIEYEILPRPKRVGDLRCDDIPHSDCTICPIKILCLDYGDNNNQSFYEILKDYKSKVGEHFDQEIHDLLKARLDKVVE